MNGVLRGMRLGWAASIVALVASGCVGTVSDPDPHGGMLALDGVPLDLEPGSEIAAGVWMHAPQSCDGRLDEVEDWTVHYAEDASSLGVVIDEHGRAVCVDTWQGIREELQRAMGDPSPDPMLPRVNERRP